MIAEQVEIGQFFVCDGETLQRINSNLGTNGWEHYPGVLCVNTRTGGFVGLGGANIIELAGRPDNPRREMVIADVVKLIEREYEFGVGGIAEADDLYYALVQYQPTGEKHTKLVGRDLARGPLPNGQLWQSCTHYGCDTEPVCVDCFCCERHCHCGD